MILLLGVDGQVLQLERRIKEGRRERVGLS